MCSRNLRCFLGESQVFSKHAKKPHLTLDILNTDGHLNMWVIVLHCKNPCEMWKLKSGSHQAQNFSQISKYVSTHYFSRSFDCCWKSHLYWNDSKSEGEILFMVTAELCWKGIPLNRKIWPTVLVMLIFHCNLFPHWPLHLALAKERKTISLRNLLHIVSLRTGTEMLSRNSILEGTSITFVQCLIL